MAVGITFADQFGVDEVWLKEQGVFNPTLDVDAPLFIDPFLLPDSKHKEFSECAFETYEAHFTQIYRLIAISEGEGDKAWQGALAKFRFSESRGMGGTCLGYSQRSDGGRGFGTTLSLRGLRWAKSVIQLGVKDPEMFSSMPLFEKGIGPDLISDMVASITIDCIIKFNHRILDKLEADTGKKLLRQNFRLNGRDASLLKNPHSNKGDPVILVADDVLKHLPLMDDPRELKFAAEQNSELRGRVNAHIGEIFKIRHKAEKENIKQRAMESAEKFQAFLDLLKIVEKQPYDLYKDPQGLLAWSHIANATVAVNALEIKDDPKLGRLERITRVVEAIIDQFTHLVEDNRLWRVFYVDDKPRHERFAQLLFFAIAVSYCEANDLDISPESDAGAGPVDFKFSDGSDRVLVEIKLSTNGKVVEGYNKQLKAYENAERSKQGYYVVIDVGQMGEKWTRLQRMALENSAFASHRKLRLIDGTPRASASKL